MGGCNYYARIVPSQDDKLNMINHIINDEFDELKEYNTEPIHIGKYSAGWRFVFNHNNWKYFYDGVGLERWLKSVFIYDEYGDEYSYDDFWELVKSKFDEKTHAPYIDTSHERFEYGIEFLNSTYFS